MSGGPKNEAQSSWKNLEGRPICSLHKKCWFFVPANEIRMPSLIPRELGHTLQWQLTGLTDPIKSYSFGSVQNIPFLCNRWVIVWSTTTLYVPVIIQVWFILSKIHQIWQIYWCNFFQIFEKSSKIWEMQTLGWQCNLSLFQFVPNSHQVAFQYLVRTK